MKLIVPVVAVVFAVLSVQADDTVVSHPASISHPASVLLHEGTNSVTADVDTNAVPLKDLMASNNIVTNSIGTILVKISPTLWVGRYEVTQKEYQKLMGSNPSAFAGPDNPVDTVSWNDAMAFCQKLTDQERSDLPPGYGYSIPTEMQWQSLAANVDLKDAVMRYVSPRSGPATVGSLGASAQGLYDLRGNVMEWCLDSGNSVSKVLRGGSWDTWVEPSSRIEFCHWAPADEKKNDYGFRLVLETSQ